MHLVRVFFTIFIPLFVVVDPAGTLPLFLALTERFSPERRRMVARFAVLTAAGIGVGFLIVGQWVLAFLGVQFSDFQIAGGLLLVVLAIVDLLGDSKPAVNERELENIGEHVIPSLAIAPLAIPLIVGPATLTTGLVLVSTYAKIYGIMDAVGLVAAALLANLGLLFLAMWHSELFIRLVGRQALSVMNKIVMILLAAIAVSLIREGLVDVARQIQGFAPRTSGL
jgi:multiple antibiotic resistance protein